MWANISHWTLRKDRLDEELISDALRDAARVVSREGGFLEFRAIRTAEDRLVVVTSWKSEQEAHRASGLTPTIQAFYTEYVETVELVSGEVILLRDADTE